MKPGAFAAQHEAAVLAKVEAVVVGRAALVEADDPDVALLHGLKRACDVDHLRDADVLAGSRGAFSDGRVQRSRTALRQHDSVNSGTVGGAEQGAEIVGVFDSIERQEEPVSAGAN